MTQLSNEFIRTAYENRFMRTREEVDAFEGALAAYANQIGADDLPALYDMFENETEHHEVMFGLLHLVETLPAAAWVPAYLRALPRMLQKAPEWADTILARSLNGVETNALLARELGSLPRENADAVRYLLNDLARAKPRPVGVRAEQMLGTLPPV